EPQAAMLALLSGGGLARRPVRARLEAQVAPAALATAREQRRLAVLDEIGDQLAGVLVEHLRAHRHAQADVLAGGAVLIGTASALAVAREELALVPVVDERVDVAVGHCPDAAAAPAVAAVGAAARNVLLPTERHRAGTAVAAGHLDARFVDEFHGQDAKAPLRGAFGGRTRMSPPRTRGRLAW